METIDINYNAIPFYVDYFHAISLRKEQQEEQTDIFMTNAGSVMITPFPKYDAYDVMATVINPLKEQGFLKVDGERLLVPLEGLLVVPDVATTTRFPLVIIAHGNFSGHFFVKETEPTGISKGHFTLTKLREHHPSLPEQMPSYRGYKTLQDELSKNRIASFSINLNIVNDLDSKRVSDLKSNLFERQAVDFSQRILLTFLHLKLLRILADEPIDPSSENDQPIKFLDGTTFKTLPSVLANPVLDHAGLQNLREVIRKKIDFNKLGFMGHSRGADAVSRLPAYFFAGATAPDPTFPVHTKVDDRIKALAMQIGRPQREVIKCILALEPTATINESDPKKHGYVIDNSQTMFFVGVGTHDEDVSLDPVRIYEYPSCPKVMIAINGASHKRFNSEWVKYEDENKDFPTKTLKLNLIRKERYKLLLPSVFGSCFIGTLGDNPLALLPFTKKKDHVFDLPLSIDFQGAWKFGFPFQPTDSTVTSLDGKITAPPLENLTGSSYKFEQDIEAFFVEKENVGTFTIKIPIDPATREKLSNFNHFSFRFAKGFDVSDNAGRVEEKNFTIQFFENDTPIGKPVMGPDIKTLELRALQAFDEIKKPGETKDFEYSILLQTVEITLSEHLLDTELPRITRIDINVIPDVTKAPPNSTTKVVFGTIGGAVLGGAVGVGGAAAFNAIFDPAEAKARKILIGGGIGGAAVLGGTALYILKADKHAFVFKDFLLTNRQIPMATNP